MTNKKKGDLLEDLVAQMHEAQNVKIEKRIKLPVLNSTLKTKREFDVLISTEAAGYPIRLAISCKNVGDFCAALADVGIPAQLGILVSAVGFTKDAQESATRKGIRTLVYEGLDTSRLNASIQEAVQSVLYLLVQDITFNRFEWPPERGCGPEYSHRVKIDSMTPPSYPQMMNCIWKLWLRQEIPHQIGEHLITIVPESEEHTWLVIADLKVVGLIASMLGTYSSGALVNTTNNRIERLRIDAKFNQPNGSIPLAPFISEEALGEFHSGQGFRVTTRIAVPRLAHQSGFWPLTMKEAQRAKRLFEEGKDVNIDDSGQLNLATAWTTQ
jgi:hypothetical protein